MAKKQKATLLTVAKAGLIGIVIVVVALFAAYVTADGPRGLNEAQLEQSFWAFLTPIAASGSGFIWYLVATTQVHGTHWLAEQQIQKNAGNLAWVIGIGVIAALAGIGLVYFSVFPNAARVLGVASTVWSATVGVVYVAFFRRNVDAFRSRAGQPNATPEQPDHR